MSHVFITSESPPVPLSSQPPPPCWVTTRLCSVTVALPFLDVHINGIMARSSVCGFFHSARLFRDTVLLLHERVDFPFHCCIVFCRTRAPHFVHLLVDGCVACFCLWVVINKATVNSCMGVCMWIFAFVSLESIA